MRSGACKRGHLFLAGMNAHAVKLSERFLDCFIKMILTTEEQHFVRQQRLFDGVNNRWFEVAG